MSKSKPEGSVMDFVRTRVLHLLPAAAMAVVGVVAIANLVMGLTPPDCGDRADVLRRGDKAEQWCRTH